MRRILPGLLFCVALVGQVFPVRPLRTTPKIAWEARPGFRDFGAMAVSGDVVVTGNITCTGGVFGFNTAAGKKIWGIPGQMRGEPAVDSKEAYVVNEIQQGVFRLNCLDLKTGKVRWSVEEPDLGIHTGA
ncbi:MAG: PQQ-binding-like beta-propeller repeat protein, partial [Bryobacteraceae bacterium]